MKRTIFVSTIVIIVLMSSSIVNCAAPGDTGGGTTKVATPTFVPVSGTIQQDTGTIVISCSTAGAIIHYTTDNSSPTALSTTYTGPIDADIFTEGPAVFKAIAVKAGSADSDIATSNYTISDTLGPVPVITSTKSGGINVPFDITITFNETVAGFDVGDITVGNGSAGSFIDANPVFTFTITPTAEGTVTVDINAAVCQDTAGTPNDNVAAGQFSIYYDPNAPQAVIASGASSPTNTSPITVTMTFDRDVTGFEVGDITVGNGTTGNFTGGPQVFTADITPSGQGAVTMDIADSVCTATLTGSPNIASVRFSITYDSISPGVTIDQAITQLDPSNEADIDFTVIFSESVSDFAQTDVSISGTANPTTVVVTGSGTTYNVAVSGMTSDGTVIVSLNAGVAHDAAGNASAASTSSDNQVTYDGIQPTVAINQAGSQADPSNSSPIYFDVVFSEAVGDFSTGDVTLTGTAGATTGTVTGSGTNYTVTVSGMSAEGTVIASINAAVAHDAAGNGNTASSSGDNTVTYDGTAPSVQSVTPATGGYSNSALVSIQIDWSEAVTGFDDTDITSLVNCSVSNFTTVTASQYTFDLTASSTGAYSFRIAAGVCTDIIGNPSVGTTDWSRTYDTTGPNVALSSTAPNPTNTAYSITITFSEPINPSTFTGGDISFTAGSGSASAPTSGDNITWTSTITPTSQGTVTVTINAAAVQDLAGNNNTAAPSGITRTWDTIAPTVTSLDLTDATDSGSSNSDNITNDATPDFTGNTDEAGTLEIVSDVDGVVYTGPVSSGAWAAVTVSILNSTGATGRGHSITARVTDAAGNAGTSGALSITIDTTASVLLSKFSAINYTSGGGDYTVMVDATLRANYTAEATAVVSYNNTTHITTITDVAGNSLLFYRIYQGVSQLVTVLTSLMGTNTTCFITAGTYSVSSLIVITNQQQHTILGEGPGLTIIEQTGSAAIIQWDPRNNRTLTINGLTLRQAAGSASHYIIGYSADPNGSIQVRNIRMEGTGATGNLVNFETTTANPPRTASYWNGTGWTAATNGVGGWTVTSPSYKLYQFGGTVGSTYWQ